MKTLKQINDSFTRRAFVTGAAHSLLGLGAMPLFTRLAAAKPLETGAANDSEKSVIYLFMRGGMSHLDTFDTKPGTETQGPVDSIKTSADGIQVSEFFPNLAQQMHHVSVINSMNSTQGAHAQGQYFMHTSYIPRGTIQHPDIGAWSARHLGKINPTLPANIKIGGNSAGLGGGFLESEFAALPIRSAEAGLQHSKPFRGVTDERFNRRLQRLKQMNQEFSAKYDTKSARAYASMYDEAVRLMKSKDLAAFDLSQESDAVRDRYGRNSFGQACLLARRLVQHGVRFIEVDNGGWDTHGDNFTRVKDKGAILDQALASLLSDLSSQGMLDSTMVVLATEFGRTPEIQINQDNGRNHYPQAFSCLLAGAGIKGGFRYGKTDDEGREVTEGLVSPPNFNATIAHAIGIPLDKKVISPSKRPFTVTDDAEPVLELFG